MSLSLPEPLPVLVTNGDGSVDVVGSLPGSFEADVELLRDLGRAGVYGARGGGIVEFRFPSGRFLARISPVPGSENLRRFDLVYAEEIDDNSASRILR